MGIVHIGQSAADVGNIVPPIMVAQYRPGSERRGKPRKFGCPRRVGNSCREAVCRGVIAQQNDDVGFQGVGGVDDTADMQQRHVRSAGVNVGDDGDG
jgi:hypothetical protein